MAIIEKLAHSIKISIVLVLYEGIDHSVMGLKQQLDFMRDTQYATFLLLADTDNKEKFSQSTSGTPGSLSRKNDRYSTPSRSTDYVGTPKRSDRSGTPSGNADGADTPLRKFPKANYKTPLKKAAKMTPINIADMLNDDDFTDFMDADVE